VFEKLRETINIKLNDKQKEDVFLSINELEQTKGSDKYATAYKSFIQKTKDWVEIVSPFIPLLSNFL
jgi:dimeric dUTPase (all-alpha-NTP-PPase superfamily)